MSPFLVARFSVVALGLLVGGCATTGGPPKEAATVRGTATAHVLRVVDGDTIVVALHGRAERVRYIGIDTPETVKPDTPVQCFGPQAHRFNQRLVGGRDVSLRFDHELRDAYGRLLAYVYVHQKFVNAALVRRGYARTLTFHPNDSHAGLFDRLAQRAGRRGTGLWGRCRA